MILALARLVKDGLLAVSVLLGPAMWLLVIACFYTAWLPGNDESVLLGFLCVGLVLTRWALWGMFEGPVRIRRWFFLLASVFNIIGALEEVKSDLPNKYIAAALFLAYSLWQFIVFRRPTPKRLIQ